MMRLAFYRAAAGSLLDRAIDGLSGRGGFSHVELVLGDGRCFSSTSRATLGADEARAGLRWKRIQFKPGHWTFVDLPVQGDADWLERIVAQFCDALLRDAEREGGGYDYGAAFRFVVPWARENPRDWMCSEAVATVCDAFAFLDLGGVPPHRISPNHLYRLAVRRGQS